MILVRMIEDNHFTTVIFDYTLNIPLQPLPTGHPVFKIGHPVRSILAKPMLYCAMIYNWSVFMLASLC